MKSLFIMFFICMTLLHASLFVEPQYNGDIKVIRELDIEPSFLGDPLFIKIKNRLSIKRKDHYVQMLKRGALYIPTLRKKLHDNGIPKVFLYMAMAESNFDAHALSHTKASGLWQFMPKTAKHYGLRINRYIDERRDPIKSTDAAIAYLKQLHKLLGRWYLAALAYNCGEGRVLRAIKKAGSSDLHTLLSAKKKYLPKESRNYIRKIVSLALISKDAERLLSSNVQSFLNTTEGNTLVRVKVSPGETLEHIASKIDMRTGTLFSLNPQFNYRFTPPVSGNKKAMINIPYSKLAFFKQKYRPGKEKNMFLVHTVKSGESLGKIAHRYGISYKMILAFNHIKKHFIYPKQVLVIPVPRHQWHRYKVKKGDSIYKIARKFDIKVATLMVRNGLTKSIIHIGDRLVIPN